MTDFKKIVEDRIQKAIEEGKFDNLRGKGKPLHLDENPHESEEWRTAHHLLKTNDFTLPWIEIWNEIESDLDAARRQLSLARGKSSAIRQLAIEAFDDQVHELNRRIMEYNLGVPAAAFQKPMIDLSKEIRAALDETSI